MNQKQESHPQHPYSRLDEREDAVFYSKDRFVSHLDAKARSTIEELIGRLVVEEKPVVLDLMASWDSHIPDSVHPSRVVGLGLNENELSHNDALSEYIIHDLNETPQLPLASDTFDVVLCTVSVDYMTRPVEVFRQVGRILKPGGIFLVMFSNRYFPSKVVDVWRRSSDDQRLMLVLEFFLKAKVFDQPRVFVSKGQPRPQDDKYAQLGIPSDPVYAVCAEKRRGNGRGRSVSEQQRTGDSSSREVIEERKRQIKHTLRCPYCDKRLDKWMVPDTPFTEWPNEFFYVCFNDECSYFVQGWGEVAALGSLGSYRLMYDPLKDTCFAAPELSSTVARG